MRSSAIDLSFIDRYIQNENFSIMRKNVNESIITRDDLDFLLASLVSDSDILKQITGGADCNNKNFLIRQIVNTQKKLGFYKDDTEAAKDTISMSDESMETLGIIFDNLNDDKEDGIGNLRIWLKEKEEINSYTRNNEYINEQGLENNFDTGQANFDKKISKLNVADIAVNHLLEMIVRDLMQDILNKIVEQNHLYKDITVYKTNQYDDMMCGTDYIIQYNKKNKQTSFLGIDITTAKNQDILDNKNSKTKRRTILWDFSTNVGKKISIEKNIWKIDKDFAFHIIKRYTEKIMNGDKIDDGDTLKIAQNINEIQNNKQLEIIVNQIKNSLSNGLAA